MVKGGNHQVVTREEFEKRCIEKFDSLDEFFNCTSYKLDKYKDKLDEGMYDICKILTDAGYVTVSCCNGHRSKRAHILFNTNIVSIPELENTDFCTITHNTNKLGSSYLRLDFMFEKEIIKNIINAIKIKV